jgi:dTDP-4-amino-4,6-dideoxygalactose transaminase
LRGFDVLQERLCDRRNDASLAIEKMNGFVPFFRPLFGQPEFDEVAAVLRCGWLTTGRRVERFEVAFARAVGAREAVAVNSCTAALHLALEALGLARGDAVLVPTMSFAATAEVVSYLGALPLLVDCDPVTGNMSLPDALEKVESLAAGRLPRALPRRARVVGIIPVHVGGLMLDMGAVSRLARRLDLWIVEDAAHAFPAAWRANPQRRWRRCGENTSAVTCFSFYGNKTITTGEGGMAVTGSRALALRMRTMSLHGIAHDASTRFSEGGSSDYRIVAPGFKYNLTDLAAAIGVHQIERAEAMRVRREEIARFYLEELSRIAEIELPLDSSNRIHSWHLFPIRLRLEALEVRRDEFVKELRAEGIGSSVHWRPLHLHPYYRETFGWRLSDFPQATSLWKRLVSLPIFPGMTEEEMLRVAGAVRRVCERHRARTPRRRRAVA